MQEPAPPPHHRGIAVGSSECVARPVLVNPPRALTLRLWCGVHALPGLDPTSAGLTGRPSRDMGMLAPVPTILAMDTFGPDHRQRAASEMSKPARSHSPAHVSVWTSVCIPKALTKGYAIGSRPWPRSCSSRLPGRVKKITGLQPHRRPTETKVPVFRGAASWARPSCSCSARWPSGRGPRGASSSLGAPAVPRESRHHGRDLEARLRGAAWTRHAGACARCPSRHAGGPGPLVFRLRLQVLGGENEGAAGAEAWPRFPHGRAIAGNPASPWC